MFLGPKGRAVFGSGSPISLALVHVYKCMYIVHINIYSNLTCADISELRFARQALDETAKEKAKMEMGYNTASTENKELRDQVKEKVKSNL